MNKLLFFILLLAPLLLHGQGAGNSPEAAMQGFVQSIESATKALKTAQERGDKKSEARNLGDLGNYYVNISQQSPEIIKEFGLPTDKKVNLDKAIDYFNKSVAISDEIGFTEQLKTSYKDLYAAQKAAGYVKDAAATYTKIQTLKHAILNPTLAKEMETKRLNYEYSKREDSLRRQEQLIEQRAKEQAQRESEQSQKLSQQVSQQQQQLQASNQTLTAAQKEKDAARNALQKTQTDLNLEKTNSEEKTRELTQAEATAALQAANLQLQQSKLQLQQDELQIKDKALEQRRKERYLYIIGIFVLLAFSLLIYRNNKVQKKSHQAVIHEKKRSEELLLNILPAEVASELMQKGFTDAKHFYDVTVLFTDFVNFTMVAESMTPEKLVGELHVCFKAFDMILGKYHIEKIKTVGDAYLAVAGLPISNPNHATDIVSAAMEIREFMAKRKAELGDGTFGVRIGINSGNVVAGIVGVRKFSYDIWGDTVNIAARMEQNCEEGKINISDTTYQLVKDKYSWIYRGKIMAKNKGDIDMYYLN